MTTLQAVSGAAPIVAPAPSAARTPAARLTYFDELYRRRDPYGTRRRWYERRKRRVLLDALPRERFARAFEPACGSGELTFELAARCDQVLASDYCRAALAQARQTVHALRNVEFAEHCVPVQWPAACGHFDLIVVSELCSFLDTGGVAHVGQRCAASLAGDGVLVACDWRHPFEARELEAEAAHALLDKIGLHRIVRHEEEDFLLGVWSRDGRSVARQEGIV
ncbi:methyltransferase domain-containing protein [Variovorax sp. RCC_210]|uniref:methyltransferase domain-containing protein n=1 Tax=Variovorax sp. RCC_210 TaxID=3239217 RepID=UPI0035251111